MNNGVLAQGFFLYLLGIFLPGIGLGEALNAWKREDPLLEKIGFALGLGLAFDTLLIMIRTSGLSFSWFVLRGIGPETVYLAIAFGAIVLMVTSFRKGGVALASRPTRMDSALLLMMFVQGVIIYAWLQKYPIFPAFQSPDYGLHVQAAEGLESGAVASVAEGLFSLGILGQLASAFIVVGGEPLVAGEMVMAIIVVLSAPLFYLAARRLLLNEEAGLAAAAIYILSGTLWFNSVFTTGLYTDFFGILALLLFLTTYIEVAGKVGSWKAWGVFLLGLMMIYFSTPSSITLLPAIAAVPFLKLVEKSVVKPYALPSIVSLVPGVAVLVAFRGLPPNILSQTNQLSSTVGGSFLSAGFATVPLLGFVSLAISDDLQFVFLLILTAAYVYRGIPSRRGLLLLPAVWFILLVLVSSFFALPSSIKFSALLPLEFMAGYGLFTMIPRLRVETRLVKKKKEMKKAVPVRSYAKVSLILAALLVPTVVDSWTQYAVFDASTRASASSHAQQEVYSAIYWLKDNTPANSTYISLTDWRFTYTNLFFRRTTNIVPIIGQYAILIAAKQERVRYLIVTQNVTVSLPPTYNNPWNQVQETGNFTQVYINDDVKIFKLTY